ncbi:hypothetical protein TWF506_001149 [Arthrobotrys conoides]|uniref:Uncharacterized protein n=1 Tax=Arthrobotrys conoides TaxID=74498 RepID=A0AAN8S1J9_9PEZI
MGVDVEKEFRKLREASTLMVGRAKAQLEGLVQEAGNIIQGKNGKSSSSPAPATPPAEIGSQQPNTSQGADDQSQNDGESQPQGPHELDGDFSFGPNDVQVGGIELPGDSQSITPSEDMFDEYPEFWNDTLDDDPSISGRLYAPPPPVPEFIQNAIPNSHLHTFLPSSSSSSTTPAQTSGTFDKELRFDDPLLNKRLIAAALQMLKKLRLASKLETASPQLRIFVDSLGGLDNIIRIGLDSLKSILDGNIPTNITQVYCFLHVAYAMSRAEKNAKDEDLPPLAFRDDLEIFRRCLSSIREVPDQPSQQDLFDEIVGVMWKEVQKAIEWTGSFLDKDLSKRLRDSMKADIQAAKGSNTKRGPPGGIRRKPGLTMKKTLPGKIPNNLTIPELVVRQDITMIFAPPGAFNKSLSVTIDQIVNSTIFQDILITVNKLGFPRFFYLYLNTVSSDMYKIIEYELRFPLTEDATDCVFCGDPHAWDLGCPTCDKAIQRVTLPQTIALQGLYNQVIEELNKTKGNTCLVVPWLLNPSTNPTLQNTTPVKPKSVKTGDYVCSVSNCPRGPWVNKQSLDQHVKGYHTPKSQTYLICGFNGCTAKRGHKGGIEKASDNMRTHKRENNHFTPEELVKGTFGLIINVKE